MRAAGDLLIEGDDGRAELTRLTVDVGQRRVRTTIGPPAGEGVTIETDNRAVWHHHVQLEAAHKAAAYRNSPPPPPRFKGPKPAPAGGPIACPDCGGTEPDCARCEGTGVVVTLNEETAGE